MEDLKGRLAVSVMGRDQGKAYVVVNIIDEFFVQVADGTKKTLSCPKRKHKKHIAVNKALEKLTMDWTDDKQGDDRISNYLKCHEKEV